MTIWHAFSHMSAPMPFQMALDEVLFRRKIDGGFSHPIIRFFFSSEPWITVGYSHPKDEVSGPVPVCRRITGGGKVLHGKDLIFSIIARKEEDESFGSVRVSYWKIHEAVKNAFDASGHPARFYRCDEKLPRLPAGRQAGECFINPIATDLSLGGRKVAGGAQKRSLGVLLHQESLQLPVSLEPFDFAEKLKQAFQTQFNCTFQDTAWEPEVLEMAADLAYHKYASLTAAAQ